MMRLGFIGAGNMARALLAGILEQGVLAPAQVHVCDCDGSKVAALKDAYGVTTHATNAALAQSCDVVVLAVKPAHCAAALEQIKESCRDKALVSVVTGWARERLARYLDPTCRILRVMPNTPCLVGEGMTAFDQDFTLNEAELAFATTLFRSVGEVVTVPSRLMSAVVGVSGSGPAYFYLFIEALADAGVLAGLDRATAYTLAAQTAVGAGKMVQKTGRHPGALKDDVCSPGGTTIQAVRVLEQKCLRSGVIEAAAACMEKAQQLEHQ